jgi:hypothetical protein
MTAGIGFGESSLSDVGHNVVVRPRSGGFVTYELTVVACDVVDAVGAAGGWMYDRVRAGWKVNVVVPDRCDVLPLRILGVHALSAEQNLETVRNSPPAALAVSTEVLCSDDSITGDVLRIINGDTTEVTVWGDELPAELARRVNKVQHRLSGAARAIKEHAALAAGLPSSSVVEEFRSCALWYPHDGRT